MAYNGRPQNQAAETSRSTHGKLSSKCPACVALFMGARWVWQEMGHWSVKRAFSSEGKDTLETKWHSVVMKALLQAANRIGRVYVPQIAT